MKSQRKCRAMLEANKAGKGKVKPTTCQEEATVNKAANHQLTTENTKVSRKTSPSLLKEAIISNSSVISNITATLKINSTSNQKKVESFFLFCFLLILRKLYI